MYKLLLKKGTPIAFIVGFVLSAFAIISMITMIPANTKADDFETLSGVSAFTTSTTIAVILIVAALAAIIIGGLWGLIKNPKSSSKFLLYGGLLVLLLLVLIFTGKVETSGPIKKMMESNLLSGSTSRTIGGGIMITVILLALALIAIVVGEIRNIFK